MLWFRLHTELYRDPKVQFLEPSIFKIYINCLCYAGECDKGGKLGTLFDVSYALRETKEAVSSAFHALEEIGLIETVDETFHIPQWNKKQYKSDTSTDRVREWRKNKKRSMKQICNVTETPTDTDTDTEKNKQKEKDLLSDLLEEEFEIFFKDYGKHGNKKTAKSKFIKIRETTPLDELIEGNKKYDEHLEIETWKKKKNLVTWLNQECWKDEYETDSSEEYLKVPDSEWATRVKIFQTSGQWHDEWGPDPDQSKNNIPENILIENNYQKRAAE